MLHVKLPLRDNVMPFLVEPLYCFGFVILSGILISFV